MKKITVALFVMLIATFAMTTASEKPWFDMENCAFCKSLGADQAMMMQLGWEHYNIDNGSMTVSTIPKQYTEKWEQIRADWKVLGEKMAAGEKLTLCGMCEAMGPLMMNPAVKSQEVKWSQGYISMMTSDDPTMVEKIHAFTDRTNAELKKMEEQMKSEMGGHEGHGH